MTQLQQRPALHSYRVLLTADFHLQFSSSYVVHNSSLLSYNQFSFLKGLIKSDLLSDLKSVFFCGVLIFFKDFKERQGVVTV